MMARAAIVAIPALLLAVFVVRSAFVDAYGVRDPAKAAGIWPSQPDVILASGLTEVGTAAAAGQPVSPEKVRQLVAASSRAPLAPEPFLVRGVEAQLAGDEALAYRAFGTARDRDPRSVAARYFLADHYLKTGQTRAGLTEISALTRLVPQSLGPIAPYLVAFARSPGGAQQVKAMLRDQPRLEPLLLSQLAADPRDAPLAMALWRGQSSASDRAWQERLVNTLVSAGRYQEARSVWTRFSGASTPAGELVDPGFESRALPPFGWTFQSGPAGLAEPEGGERLHVLYYGRDNLVLARQLLMLKPGRHRLSMRVGGASPAADSLAWIVRCLPSQQQLISASLASTKGGVMAVEFVVPPQGCAAQQLELAGTAPELPEQADVTISELRLSGSAGQ